MKKTLLALLIFINLAAPLVAIGHQYGDFTYSSSATGIIIIRYTGYGSAVDIPATIAGLAVTGIGDWAFNQCGSLRSVTIPNSVTSIGIRSFSFCTKLMSVTIPSSVTSIGNYAFGGCDNLTAFTVDAANMSYTSGGGVLFDKDQTTLIQYPGAKTGSYLIPSSAISIGNNAFRNCSRLTAVTIPNSVTSIGEYGFGSCTHLTNVGSSYEFIPGLM